LNEQDLIALRALTALGQTLLEGRIDFLDYIRVLRTTLDKPEPEKEMYK